MRYTPKPAEQNKFETHRNYADIQVILSGREIMQTAPAGDLKPVTDYDGINDYQCFKVDQNITSLIVEQNHFTIFYPGEAHRPSCLVKESDGDVFKLVFKVRMHK
jgi:YhcH/YjgK/YiaL family protein